MARKRTQEETVQRAIVNGKLDVVGINSIKEWDENPNKLKEPKGGLSRLQSILKKHGQITPVVVYPADNMIRKGNHTWKAMKKNGMKRILVLFVKFPSLAAANAYGVADNMGGNDTEMDYVVVNKMIGSTEFKGIDEDEIQLLTGFNDKEMNVLRLDDGSFATSNYSKAADEFEAVHAGQKKKKAFWFWFEVDSETIFEQIKELYSRTKDKGKRLHRELDPDLLTAALIYGKGGGTDGKDKKTKRKYVRK